MRNSSNPYFLLLDKHNKTIINSAFSLSDKYSGIRNELSRISSFKNVELVDRNIDYIQSRISSIITITRTIKNTQHFRELLKNVLDFLENYLSYFAKQSIFAGTPRIASRIYELIGETYLEAANIGRFILHGNENIEFARASTFWTMKADNLMFRQPFTNQKTYFILEGHYKQSEKNIQSIQKRQSGEIRKEEFKVPSAEGKLLASTVLDEPIEVQKSLYKIWEKDVLPSYSEYLFLNKEKINTYDVWGAGHESHLIISIKSMKLRDIEYKEKNVVESFLIRSAKKKDSCEMIRNIEFTLIKGGR